jgi:hypothetical protein
MGSKEVEGNDNEWAGSPRPVLIIPLSALLLLLFSRVAFLVDKKSLAP